MSARTTQKAETAHGTIEYQTVTCDSCGNEMLEDDAEPFTIGNREGVACPHCVDEGPVSFPRQAKEKFVQGFGTVNGDGIGFLLGIGWFILPMSMFFAPIAGNEMDDFAKGISWTMWVLLLYGAAIYGFVMVF